jgi:hypothetical protein
MPDWVIRDLEENTWRFFWGSKSFLVKKDFCRLPLSLGGQGIIDFKVQSQTLKLKWIKTLLDSDSPSKWRFLAFHNLGKYAGSNLGKHIFELELIPNRLQLLSPFYRELFSSWKLLDGVTRREFDNRTIDQILDRPLFDNPAIRNPTTGRPIHLGEWIKNGIVLVKHISYEFIAGLLPKDAVREQFRKPPKRAKAGERITTRNTFSTNLVAAANRNCSARTYIT